MKNKKGFTLVELLAVIVIISILVMMAIPNISKYVLDSRKKAFVEDARTIVSSTRSHYLSGRYELSSNVTVTNNQITYSKEGVQDTLSKKLGVGPFNEKYKDAGAIIKKTTGDYGEVVYEYYICLIDEGGNGFDYTKVENLNVNSIATDANLTGCGDLPVNKYTVSVTVNNGSVAENESTSKVVNEGAGVTFNLVPNSPDMYPTVNCSTGNGGVSNNVLSVTNVKSDMVCTVDYAQVLTVLYADGTLIINENPDEHAANLTKHGGILSTYDGMSSANTYDFDQPGARIPWINEQTKIKRIEIGQKISPTSTSKWFINLKYVTYVDLTNLDFSNVTDTSRMFEYTGAKTDVTSFTVKGLNTADLSNVKNASKMFYWAGSYASSCTIGDVSNWNTSNMEDMSYMFSALCRSATALDLGDLSTKTVNGVKRWDTSNVTDMSRMFSQTGQDVKNFEIKGISNWNVSNVTNMDTMFSQAGYHSETWSVGDLSNWDTRKVTNMHYMFRYAGADNTIWTSIGTLKVYASDISYIFSYSSNAKATLNIYSNPTTYEYAFQGASNANGGTITVNYSNSTANIDSIIGTKSYGSNVVKGVQLD